MEDDPYNNQLTSVFYGHPLTDELFGIPLDIYLTPGFVWHWESEVQSSIQEYVIAIKAYYTFEWPVKWRFGVAEGLSYVSGITHIEQAEMDEKGYEPSQLLNYLDFSVDVNVGDLINQKSLDNLWVATACITVQRSLRVPPSLDASRAAVTTIPSTFSTTSDRSRKYVQIER